MKNLSKKEEEVLSVLWKLKKAFVKEIIDELAEPKPHYNTVSTIIRRLQGKGLIGYEAFGQSHRYFPLTSHDNHKKKSLHELMSRHFNNSFKNLASFFAQEENLSDEELEEIVKIMKEKKSK